MSAPRDPDVILAAWLDDGPIDLPSSTRRAISTAVRTTPQSRAGLGRPAWRPLMSRFSMFAGVAAVIAVVVGAFALAMPRPPAPVSGPAALPTSAAPVTATTPASPSAAPVLASPQVALPGSIAYSRVNMAAAEIVIEHVDGSGSALVITMPGQDVQPAWSRDNTQIAWAASDGIRIANADGTGGALVTDQGAADSNPEWSPDDTLIAFDSHRDGDSELYTQAIDGGAPSPLTSNDVADDDPSWSSVTNRIAFVSARGGARDIWTMDPDGKALAQLTGDVGNDDDPAWSPDGTRIAFVSDRGGTGTTAVYVMNADGSNVQRVTVGTRGERDPTWSPDGRYLAFRRLVNNSVIVIVDMATHADVGTLSQQRNEFDTPAWQNP
jgi:hypothetical protein